MSDPLFDDFEEAPAEEVEQETAMQYVAPHFFLNLLLLTNTLVPILYWFLLLKPKMDADAAATAVFKRNWWWFGAGWHMAVWGMVGLYGFPAFIGFFTWFGIKFFDKIFAFWMTVMVNYIGSIMHFFMLVTFTAGSAWWVDNTIMTRTTGWIITAIVVGWSVITFLWMGLSIEKSKRYMFLMSCKDKCFPEQAVEEEEEFEELADDAIEFHHGGIWDF